MAEESFLRVIDRMSGQARDVKTDGRASRDEHGGREGEYPAQRPRHRQRPMPGIGAVNHEVNPFALTLVRCNRAQAGSAGRVITVGAEHAAVDGLGFPKRVTAFALVEPLAGAGGYGFQFRVAAVRTGQLGLQEHSTYHFIQNLIASICLTIIFPWRTPARWIVLLRCPRRSFPGAGHCAYSARHGIQQARQRQQAVGIERIADAGTLDFAGNDAARFEDAQMFEICELGEPDIIHDIAAYAGLFLEQQTDDVNACGMAERFDNSSQILRRLTIVDIKCLHA